MKTNQTIISIAAALLLCLLIFGMTSGKALDLSGDPRTYQFTYQGQIKKNGESFEGNCDMKFSLFDEPTAQCQQGDTIDKNEVAVSEGIFTVALDFGLGLFGELPLWLEIQVRCPAGSGEFKTLSPRQELTWAPFALFAKRAEIADYARTAWSTHGNNATSSTFLGTTNDVALELKVNGLRALRLEPNATSPNLIGGSGINVVANGIVGATVSGGGYGEYECGSTLDQRCWNQITGDFGVVGGGVANTASNKSVVAGGDSNQAGGDYSSIGGGAYNQASGTLSSIGGGANNSVSGMYGTISGGGPVNPNNASTTSNRVTDDYGTVSGGGGNQAGDNDATTTDQQYATVSGGMANTASGYFSTVGGGGSNTASIYGSTISGGTVNISWGKWASIGGGFNNLANNEFATIPGGSRALASNYGQQAYASGQFTTWGDAQTSVYVLRGETNASQNSSYLYLDGATKSIVIKDNQAMTVDILVVALSDLGWLGSWRHEGVIRYFNNHMFISLDETEFISENTYWEVSYDSVGNTFYIEVYGQNQNVRWVATVRTAEVSW